MTIIYPAASQLSWFTLEFLSHLSHLLLKKITKNTKNVLHSFSENLF